MPLRKSSLKILRVCCCCSQPRPRNSWEAPLRSAAVWSTWRVLSSLQAGQWRVSPSESTSPKVWSLLKGHPFARTRAACPQGQAGRGGMGWTLYTRGHVVWAWIGAWCSEEEFDLFIQLVRVESYPSLKAWDWEESCSGLWRGSLWSKPMSVRGYRPSKVPFLLINIFYQGGWL